MQASAKCLSCKTYLSNSQAKFSFIEEAFFKIRKSLSAFIKYSYSLFIIIDKFEIYCDIEIRILVKFLVLDKAFVQVHDA
jgi:hypothetical protein